MKVLIGGAQCSMGCLYAEGAVHKCQCPCEGKMHGFLGRKPQVGVTCSPAVENRCKNGQEDGECQCACGGANHGLYREIEDFEIIPVIGLV